MINLLPDDRKQELRAARNNVILLRYNLATLGAIALLAVISGLFLLVLAENKRAAENANVENNEKTARYADIRKQADSYRTDLNTAKQILDKEVTYTDTIFAIAKHLPKGAVLDTLTLNPQSFAQQSSFVVRVKNYETATALKRSFEQSDIFTDAHFQTINSDAATGNSDYPITVTISATIKKATK